MGRPDTPAHKTLNWPADSKALRRRGSLTNWFDPEMTWAAQPTGRRGRRPVCSDAAAQTCLTMKVLFGLALRQTTGFIESLLRLTGLDWEVPDFSTLSRRQKTLAANIPHGGAKRRVWRKVLLGIDEETLEIRAVEFIASDIGDAPMLPELLAQIPADQEIASVTADGACDTRKCHDAIAERGACAVIPPRRNAKPWKAATAGAVARNEALRASKYLGRALWQRW